MTEENTEETTEQAVDTPSEALEAPSEATDAPDTFPREYVEKLRSESAENRVKAKRADELSQRLFTLTVQNTGRLADATDLAYDEALLEDEDALNEAIDSLLEKKPHLASRKPRGDIGQGRKPQEEPFSIFNLMRANA